MRVKEILRPIKETDEKTLRAEVSAASTNLIKHLIKIVICGNSMLSENHWRKEVLATLGTFSDKITPNNNLSADEYTARLLGGAFLSDIATRTTYRRVIADLSKKIISPSDRKIVSDLTKNQRNLDTEKLKNQINAIVSDFGRYLHDSKGENIEKHPFFVVNER